MKTHPKILAALAGRLDELRQEGAQLEAACDAALTPRSARIAPTERELPRPRQLVLTAC